MLTADKLLRAVAYALFFLMLFLPSTYQPLKGALLGLTLTGILMAAGLTGRFPLAPAIALGALGYSALGLAYVVRGVTAGAPGALAMLNVYVVWPLVYTLLVVGASFPGVLRALTKVAVYAGLTISLYGIIYVLHEAGFWPSAFYYAVDPGQRIEFSGTHIEFRLRSTSTLLFLVPYLIGALFVFPAHAPVSRPVLWLTALLGLTAVLLSGRRALLVVVALAPAFALLFRGWLSATAKHETRHVVRRVLWAAPALVLVLIVIMTAIGGMEPAGFVDMVASGFRFNSDEVAMTRRDQFFALVNGWLQDPLFGSGHGAPVRGVIRSVEMPWAYELTYVALLYHTGIVGVVAYCVGLAWMFSKSRAIAGSGWPQAPYLMATLVGTASFMLATITNPYLEKYDSIWVLFLPIAFINVWLTERAGSQGTSLA